MLVLTRKLHETITIGEGIKITIVRVKGNKVRIGIDAPNDVRVVRGELTRHEDECEAKMDQVESPQTTIAPLATALASPVLSTSLECLPIRQNDLADESFVRGPLSRHLRQHVQKHENQFVAMGVATIQTD